MASESERSPYPLFGRNDIAHVLALAHKRHLHPVLTDAHLMPSSVLTTPAGSGAQCDAVSQNRRKRGYGPDQLYQRETSFHELNTVVSLVILLPVKLPGHPLPR